MDFQQKYLEISNLVQEEINQVLCSLVNGVEVREPLKTSLFKVLNAPAKHIRPLISFLYLKAIGAEIDENQILYQSAIELVHNASLIHDDIIDNSEKRRGVKTLNFEFDGKLAVVSGDYLLAVALDRVLKIGSLDLIQMFADTLSVMCTGEVNQYFNKFEIPSIDEYIKKSEQKTAKLFETALCGSMLIATSDKMYYDSMMFARNFGIAFQIRDDLINCKTTKTDIKDGIYTAPVILGGNVDNLQFGIAKTQVLLNNYVEMALSNLKELEDNIYKKALEELLGLIKNG